MIIEFIVFFIFLIFLNCCNCLEIIKCCAPADRINSLKNNTCESNRNNVPLNPVNIQNYSSFSFSHQTCKKVSISFKGINYEASNDGISIFSPNETGIVQMYQDYCLDTDSQAGHDTIILICENFVNIPKCCPMVENLMEESGKLICSNRSNSISISTINLFIPGNSNINFQISNQTEFSIRQMITILMNFSISEDQNLMIKGVSEFCLDELKSNWIIINLNYKSKERTFFYNCYPLIVSLNIICMLLTIYEFNRTCKFEIIQVYLISFVICFLIEQIILTFLYHYVNLRELIIIKNLLTILYFWILSGIWIILNLESETKTQIYFSIKFLIFIIGIETIFLHTCFFKIDVGMF